jgi:hypothetical protein
MAIYRCSRGTGSRDDSKRETKHLVNVVSNTYQAILIVGKSDDEKQMSRVLQSKDGPGLSGIRCLLPVDCGVARCTCKEVSFLRR